MSFLIAGDVVFHSKKQVAMCSDYGFINAFWLVRQCAVTLRNTLSIPFMMNVYMKNALVLDILKWRLRHLGLSMRAFGTCDWRALCQRMVPAVRTF